MGLIDKKVLKQDLMMYGLIVFADMDIVTKAMKIVNRQLEIDAVPVDWIAKYLRTADDYADSVIAEMMRKYYDDKK